MQDYIIKTSGRALAQALIADLPEEHGLSIITFGVVSRPTGETATDEDRQEVPVMEPVDGYWLAVRCEAGALPESWTPFVVDDPGYLPGGFSPYVEPTPSPEKLAQAKEAKLSEIMAGSNAMEAVIKSRYSKLEIDSWGIQQTQAEIILSGGTLPEGALLFALANANGVNVSDFAVRVLQNVALAEVVTKSVVSQQQAYELMLKSCTTVEEVQKIAVNYTLHEVTA